MTFNIKLHKLKNKISIYEINTGAVNDSMIIVNIYKGINDDPILNGGTYHYLEHMLGAYFEINTYGSFYDHLLNINGTTISNYLHIFKKFKFDTNICEMLLNNIISFITCTSFDNDIMENEKWMVNNEITSKLYETYLLNIFFIYEQIKTNRIYSTFGSNKSLDKEVLMNCKLNLRGSDYAIYFVNLQQKIVNKYINKFSNITFPKNKKYFEIPLIKKMKGKYILNIKDLKKNMGIILMNIDCELLMYLNIALNDYNLIEYNGMLYSIYVYHDFIYISLNDIFNISLDINTSITTFIEVFIYFLQIAFPMEIEVKPITIMHFNSIVHTTPELTYLRNNNILDAFNKFKSQFIPKQYNKFDFIFVNISHDIIDVDSYNADCNLYYKLSPYKFDILINIDNIITSINKLNSFEINIDYIKYTINANIFTSNDKSVFLIIESNNSNCIYIFFVYFILSNTMPFYFSFFNHCKFVINCMFQYEQVIIEDNIKLITYRDIYNLIVELQTNSYDYMNNKNNFFFLIKYYLDKVDINYVYKMEYKKVIDNNYIMTIFNNSKFIINNSVKKNKKNKNNLNNNLNIYNILVNTSFDSKYIIIKSKTNDIFLSCIFIQYVFELLNKLKLLRKLYMFNFKSSIGNNYYCILIYAQVNNLKQLMYDLFNSLDDILFDINFSINFNVINNILIKYMLFYNIDVYKSKIDINDIDFIRNYIFNEMNMFLKM